MDIRRISLWISETFMATILGSIFFLVQIAFYFMIKFFFNLSMLWLVWPLHILNGLVIIALLLLVVRALVFRTHQYRSRWHDSLFLILILCCMYCVWLT